MQQLICARRANHRTALLAALAFSSLALRGFASVDSQVDALLARMTLDEKIGQMVQVDSAALKDRTDVKKYFIGSVLSGGNSNPADNRPKTWLSLVNGFQAEALQTRLKIPLLYGIDAVHGNNNILGAVIFPHHVGLGAANDPALVEKAAHVTADEVEGVGIRWAFDPCIAVSRDICWGRSYESYGQSPQLVAELGVAAIKGLQGDRLDQNSVLACAKHFAGDGGTENGKDQGNTVCDEATFRKLYLSPYTAAIKAGVGSIMVSFSSWNGQKMHGNKYLLTDVLKNEMRFQGFLVSDWSAIDQLGSDYKKDIETSINAGLDMIMITTGPGEPHNYAEFIVDLKGLVASGKVSRARIDDAVRRILRVKSQMGLFEKPYTDPTLTAQIGSPEHRQVARQCVRESLVLLKNSNNLLPLRKNYKRIIVTGSAANDLSTQCGGWTIDWQGAGTNQIAGGTTLLAAIKQAVSPDTQVVFSADGRDLKELSPADVVIAVIGEKPYAEFLGDRQDLRLASADAELINRAKATGVPVVTVLYSGRPLVLGKTLDESDAFVAAWLPGTEGQGMTDVLFGDYQPSGRLPRLWPANDEQLSVDHVAGKPLFSAGFGLTYNLYSQNK